MPPWLVAAGKLTLEASYQRILAMTEIVKTLQRLEVEHRQLALFTTHV